MNSSIHPKAATKSELARAYGISVRTLNTWLKSIESDVGALRGRFYTLKQVQVMFYHWGEPHKPIR